MTDYTVILAFPAAIIVGFLISLGISLPIIVRFADEHLEEKQALQYRVWDLEAALRNVHFEARAVLGEEVDD